ncbi:MAG: ABC transporter permease [Chloroflexota bacterium]
MVRYIVRRVIGSIPVLIGVTMLTFALANMLPGDPAREAAGRFATPEQIEAVRQRLGLDQPLPIQYLRYMERLVHGDLGTSLSTQQSVLTDLSVYFPATLELMIAAMFLTVIIGIPLGAITGAGGNRWVNSLSSLFSLLGVGMPVFWAGLIFQLVFYGKLGILPLDGRLGAAFPAPPPITNMYTVDALLAGQWGTFLDAMKHLILPALTLAIGRVASVERTTRASMLEVMRKDYMRTARAKGLREQVVIARHALKNALLPTVTTLGLQVGWLLSGTILVENIFTWGGIGTYAWQGIFRLDIPVVMGVTLISTIAFMICNLAVDIAYGYLDPRIAYE